MRSWIAAAWLGGVALVSGCAASPGAAAPAEGTASTSVVVPVDSAPPAAASGAPKAPAADAETGCFDKPVTLLGGFKHRHGALREVKPVDEALPRKLAACPSDPDPDACRFAIGKLYFEANRIADAGPIFRDLALAGERGALGARAGQHYLDCLNIIGGETEPPRDVCFDEMARQVAPLQARHCAASPDGSPAARETTELCAFLGRIEGDLERLRAEKLVNQADRDDGADRLPLYQKAGDVYTALFEKRCAFTRPDPKKKAAPPPGWTADNHCDEIIYNAMRAYMAAHRLDLAKSARDRLLDPIHGLDKRPLADSARKLDLH